MKKFHRVIIALDNTDFDEKIIQYASSFTEVTMADKLYFVYVEKRFDMPKELGITYKDETGKVVPRDETLKKIMLQKVNASFGHLSDVEITVEVLEGNPLKELSHWAKVKEADLVILGNKKQSQGSGVVARRIARNINCDLLFVPETSCKNLHKLLVPVDFSDYSKVAMDGAVQIGNELSKASITAFHVFDVPLQSYPTINMNYDSFLKSMRAFKMEALDKYLQKLDLKGVEVKKAHKENDPPGIAKHINRYAREHQIDLIIMGAQGHTLFERLLMGSVTEKLLTLDKEVPVLVLRK